MCGLWVDRVAELWLWNGSWQSHFSRGDLPRLFPEVGGRDWTTLSTCHEYLFGESVHRLLHRMTNRSLQSNYLYSVLFISSTRSTCDCFSSNRIIFFTHSFVWSIWTTLAHNQTTRRTKTCCEGLEITQNQTHAWLNDWRVGIISIHRVQIHSTLLRHLCWKHDTNN